MCGPWGLLHATRQARFRPAWRRVLFAVAMIAVFGAGVRAAPAEDDAPPMAVVAGKKWTVLYQNLPKTPAVQSLPDKGPLYVVSPLEIGGPRPGDPHLLGDYVADGDWGYDRTGLYRTKGSNAALLLASGEDFELEGNVMGEGLGGWFFIVGWKERHGYLLYNTTLKTSGSPWLIAELRDGKAIEETHREVGRHLWKGVQPFRLSVEKKQLQLTIGKETVVDELDLPNYGAGEILLGTYETKYGAKPLRIQSLRVRAK